MIFDPQGNCSSGMGINTKNDVFTIYDAITGKIDINETLLKTKVDNCYIIPSNINLTGATVEIVDKVNREFFFKENS